MISLERKIGEEETVSIGLAPYNTRKRMTSDEFYDSSHNIGIRKVVKAMNVTSV